MCIRDSFLSNRHFDPMMGAFDMEHVYLGSTVLVAVPLNAADPPPIPDIANAAGFDLDEWATWVAPPPNRAPTADEPLVDGLDAAQDGIVRMRVDTESIISRQYVLALPPGSWGGLEALPGAVLLMQQPTRGLLHDDWMDQGPDTSSTIMRYDIVDESLAPAIENAAGYVVSADKTTIAWVGAEGLSLIHI